VNSPLLGQDSREVIWLWWLRVFSSQNWRWSISTRFNWRSRNSVDDVDLDLTSFQPRKALINIDLMTMSSISEVELMTRLDRGRRVSDEVRLRTMHLW